MSRILRPALVVSSALALWCAESCLAPGSLEHEELFRIRSDAASSDGASRPDGNEIGCAAACTTFRTTCSTTGCHSSDSMAANLDLQSPGIVARLSGKPATTVPCFDQTLLVPGNPAKSLVYRKLTDPPACGLRMPLTGPLGAAEIDCVRRWVLSPSCDGASTPDGGTPDAAPGAGGTGAGGASSSGGMPSSGGNAGTGAGGRRGAGGASGRAGMSGAGGGAGMSGAGGASGGAGMSGAGGNAAIGKVIYIEAESGTLTDPMVASMDTNASGGQFVSAPTAAKNDDPTMSAMGIATYSFDVATAGDYIGFGRDQCASTSADSFWVKMDGGAWIQWNNLTNGTTWVWDTIHDSAQADAAVHYMLATGTHKFSVAYREAGAELDKIVFAGDPAFVPMGTGQ